MTDPGAWDVVVVGAGAAGLLAAARSAERGLKTLLVEKNRKPGVKILMSGGTRCNLTHATDRQGIAAAYGRRQGGFLRSALATLGPQELIDLVEAEGVPTKVEPETGKVFPHSDRAADVLAALCRRLERSGAAIAFSRAVLAIERSDTGFRLITASQSADCRQLVLAAGGTSYPGCGTSGDGYSWAAKLGHTIVRPRPALVPLRSPAEWVRQMKGLTIDPVAIQLVEPSLEGSTTARRPAADRRLRAKGSLLFTHFGLSGPAVLDVSREASLAEEQAMRMELECDFVPQRTADELLAALAVSHGAPEKRQLPSVVAQWVPRRLAEVLIDIAALTPEQRLAELPRHGRQQLVASLKRLRIPIDGTLGFRKAEVTAGGVALDEVDSRTMQSRIVEGLYFAGELLDIDGPIGGYNFQAAFSTGYLAGESVHG